MAYRIGIGYDIHRLVEGRKLVLGGIEIPYVRGLLGHSDADVLLHALCDALLGAGGEADIGENFPNTDPQYHNIPSSELLQAVCAVLEKKAFVILNVDTVVVAEEPNLMPFKKQIRENIARIMGLGLDCVNVKAKTNEGIGGVGKKEAIACYAVAIIRGGAK